MLQVILVGPFSIDLPMERINPKFEGLLAVFGMKSAVSWKKVTGQ